MTDILLACAAGLTLAWLVAAQRRLVARATRRFVALPRVEQALLVVAVGVMTVCAQKSGSNVVFNAEIEETQRRGEEVASAVQGGSGVSPLQNKEDNILSRSGETPLPPSSVTYATSQISKLRAKNSLTTNDLARCFALTRVGTNEVFDFSASDGANFATNWMLYGGATARTRRS